MPPAETYEGKPCMNCGGTTRRKKSGRCLICVQAVERRHWHKRRQNPAYLDEQAERARERYDRLTGPEYNLLLLRHRRDKALTRMEKRQQQREATHGEIPPQR